MFTQVDSCWCCMAPLGHGVSNPVRLHDELVLPVCMNCWGCIPHDRRLELGLKFAELLVDQPQRIAAVAALQAVESMCQDVAEDYRRGGLPWQQSRDDE